MGFYSTLIEKFLTRTAIYRSSHRKISIFAITQEGLVQSGSSSNSTEILMRLNCVENFMTIGLFFQKLSCKRTDTLTDSRVYSLFEYTKRKTSAVHYRSPHFYSSRTEAIFEKRTSAVYSSHSHGLGKLFLETRDRSGDENG